MRCARVLLAACIALASCASSAQVVGAHLYSHHLPSRDYQNNENLGAYLVLPNGLTVGGYRNTLRRDSYYLGETFESGPFAVSLGAITGYRYHGHPVLPMVAPSVRLWTVSGVSVRLFVVPTPNTLVMHIACEASL